MTNQTKLTGIQRLEENAKKVYTRNLTNQNSIHVQLKTLCENTVSKLISDSTVYRYVRHEYKGEIGFFPYRFDIAIKPTFTDNEEAVTIASVVFDGEFVGNLFSIKVSIYTNMDGLDRYDGRCLEFQEEAFGLSELFNNDEEFIDKTVSYALSRASRRLEFSSHLNDLIDLYFELQ